MKIKLKFFGRLAEISGKTEVEIPEITDTGLLIKQVVRDFPDLSKSNFLISVNKKLVIGNQQLKSGDEIAFLPPFAGG